MIYPEFYNGRKIKLVEFLRNILFSIFCSCYLAISFRAEPLEIWDLRTLRLLRRMSKRCPIIVDMSWSTKHHQMSEVNPKTQIHKENLVVLDNDNHL